MTSSSHRAKLTASDVGLPGGVLQVLSAHEASVVEEATARLIPGPTDDPAEVGHPGAREAQVVRYIDAMLGALDASPAQVFAGGPFSNRAGAARNDMERFIALDEIERTAWKARLADLREKYAAGVRALDTAANGDFTAATPEEQDAILAADPGGFMSLLMQHAIEGMYSNPEYGGNAGLLRWKDIGFEGDRQPRGYSDDDVRASDGPDPVALSPAVQAVLELFGSRTRPED